LLTATPGLDATRSFALAQDDFDDPVLKRRLDAEKPARLVLATRRGAQRTTEDEDAPASQARDLAERVEAIVSEVAGAFDHFANSKNGAPFPAMGVVVNRVARARAVFGAVRTRFPDTDVRLLIGPGRPVDRDDVAESLGPIRTGADRPSGRPLVVVATQCVEVGVDIDLDALITELAPLDALRQRFGRLNRAGRGIVPFASIMAWKSEISSRADDPVYGRAIKAAWDRLDAGATLRGRQKIVDFGVRSFALPLDAETLSPREDAPVLLPSHVDLLCQTSPIPAADPDVSFFLHGVGRPPDAVTVVWRADIEGREPDHDVRRLLGLVPPRAAEAICLPVWAVRRWLRGDRGSILATLADAAAQVPEEEGGGQLDEKQVFRWRGDDDLSQWVSPAGVRPGDTIVVPARHGGADHYGWNPEARERVADAGARAARPFAGRRFAVRVAPGLVGGLPDDAVAAALASAESMGWRDLRAALLELGVPAELQEDLEALGRARRGRVVALTDVYPADGVGRPRGVVFVAPLGISDAADAGMEAATEDDIVGSVTGLPVPLEDHCRDASVLAGSFAQSVGLPEERRCDLAVAALLHDTGKVDSRFQSWLHHDDPLGPDPMETSMILAKSGRDLPRSARSAAGLPARWRHEAFSVRLAPLASAFSQAKDPELVLWLIGSHHGHGRVFFPHEDPADAAPRALPAVLGLPGEIPAGTGPQSLGFDWNGADWAVLYERVRARYGTWELALMEAVLRLADHRASERAPRRTK